MKKKNKIPSIEQSVRLYQFNKPIIGLTGSIATGKTTVANILRDKGEAVISADQLIKNIYKYDSVLQFIQNSFPQAVNNSTIDFKRLREIAFSNNVIKLQLEKELYHHLPAEFNKTALTFPNHNYLIYDIPLLFEKKLETKFDYTVCVYVPLAEQLKRLIKRDSISTDLANEMISSQIDIETKKELSDFVIDNSKSLKETNSQAEKLMTAISISHV